MAREAGQLLMEIYNTDFEVEYKTKTDPVTKADKQVNAFLVERLKDRFPQDAVIAEESDLSEQDGPPADRCWYVDPLDGTKEFIAKNGEFSVMIGLAVQGYAQLGVVYQPTNDTLYRGWWATALSWRRTTKRSF